MKTENQKAIDSVGKMDEFEKALFYALGTLEELIDKGWISRAGNFEYLTPNGMLLYHAIKSIGFKPDSEVLQAAILFFKTADNDEDNARLSAAAPDLLAAIAQLNSVLSFTDDEPEQGCTVQDVFDYHNQLNAARAAAKQAIAKATGQ